MTITDSALMRKPVASADDLVAEYKSTGYKRFGKRALDLTLSIIMLPALLPIIGVLCLIVSRDGGKAIFGHKRIGRDGKVFLCWKVRTMVLDAEERLREHLAANPEAAAEWARDHKLTDDPRITRLGRFLRRSSLDELPQIWNVLVGEMSLVGPRPVVRCELHKYGEHRSVYKSMRPGITGPWQVSGRNDLSYFERVQHDLQYSRKMSLFTDLRLIALTGLTVIKATGR